MAAQHFPQHPIMPSGALPGRRAASSACAPHAQVLAAGARRWRVTMGVCCLGSFWMRALGLVHHAQVVLPAGAGRGWARLGLRGQIVGERHRAPARVRARAGGGVCARARPARGRRARPLHRRRRRARHAGARRSGLYNHIIQQNPKKSSLVFTGHAVKSSGDGMHVGRHLSHVVCWQRLAHGMAMFIVPCNL